MMIAATSMHIPRRSNNNNNEVTRALRHIANDQTISFDDWQWVMCKALETETCATVRCRGVMYDITIGDQIFICAAE